MTSRSSRELKERTDTDVIDRAVHAESVGMDAVWIGDSVTARPRHEPLTTLAGIATLTEEIELGCAVYLPTHRHVINVAHATATLDQISEGRLLLGVGMGRGEPVRREYGHLNLPFERRGRFLNETLDALVQLWSGDPVTYNGEFYSFDAASIGFKPVNKPPILVASSVFDPEKGFPVTIRERIRVHGDGWLPTGIPPKNYAVGLDLFKNEFEEAGRDPEDATAACYVDVVVAGSEEAAIEEARQYLMKYYPKWSDLPDSEVKKRGAFGPPDTVRHQISIYEDAGVEQFVIRFLSVEQQRNLDEFAALID